MSSAPESLSPVPAGAPRLHAGHVAAGLTLLALLVGLFWSFFYRQVRFALVFQADWGHTLVIPLIAGYFVYLKREKLLSRPFRTTWIGLVPMVLGVAIYVLCSVGPLQIRHHNLQGLGVWVTGVGLVLLFCGFRAMRWLWFPLVYLLVFGQSVSNRGMEILTFKLQDMTAVGSFHTLSLLGLDVDRVGNTLYLFDQGEVKPLNIAEACSGMRMLMAFFALGVAMAYTGLRRAWQRVLLVAAALPTALFVNVLRVVSLALLVRVDSEFVLGDFHTFVGLVWLVPAFLIYLGLMWIIRRLVVERAAPGEDAAAAHGEGA